MPTRMAAFQRTPDGYWKQTPEAEKVLGIIKSSGGSPFKIEPAPSPMAGLNGEPMWGSGGGVHMPDTGRTFVDPINGSVSVAAHEAGHAAFHTALDSEDHYQNSFSKLVNHTKSASPGNRLRAVYETLSKPQMLEEANAQGVARAAIDKAGYQWENNGWKGLPMEITGLSDDIRPELAYPGEYRFGGRHDEGAKFYGNVEQIGPGPVLRSYLQDERDTIDATRKSLVPAMERQYQKGYNLIK